VKKPHKIFPALAPTGFSLYTFNNKMPPKKSAQKNPPPKILEYTPETERILILRTLVKENLALPVSARRSQYDLLLAAGYQEQRARSLSNILVQNGKRIIVAERGFDVESAKLVVSELAHDELVKPEVRLKAAEDMLKVLGIFKESPDFGEGASAILAQLLSDMFKASENRPKIERANIIEQEIPKANIIENGAINS